MNKENQISEVINDITIPLIIIGNKKWYPISYLFTKVLGRKQFRFNTNQREQLNNYLNKYEIDFGFSIGGIQLCSCIEEKGLILYLQNSKTGSLTTDKRILLNGLLKYLKLEKIDDRDKNLNTKTTKEIEDIIINYPDYIKDIIYNFSKENNYNIKWKKCNQCGKYYPIHELFFSKNPKCADGFMTLCKDCYKSSSSNISCGDSYLHNINKNYGYDTYKKFKEYYNIEFIYDFCIKNNESFPSNIYKKENYLKVIKYLYSNNIISNNQLNIQDLKEISKLEKSSNTSLEEVYEYIDKDFKRNLYKYIYFNECSRNLIINKLDEEDIIANIKNYIKYANISNIYVENIQDIVLNKCNLKEYISHKKSLYYIKEIYNTNEFPAYKFEFNSVSDFYWTIQENRIKELKNFIAELNINKNKIPLYLTIQELKKSNTYGILNKVLKKYYNNDLFKWVNEIYPNTFIKEDFNINRYRNTFDSIEEESVDKILRDFFNNVIYNNRNTDNTILFGKSIPDWLVITDKYCIIVEYFGFCVNNINTKNLRIIKYKNKTINKHKKYSQLVNYKHLYIYPRDLKDNNKILINKIKNILNEE